MAITVRQLIEQQQHPLTLRAGSAGLDREVLWVHASDLELPWQYLGRSEALLTNGTGMTGDPMAQVRFVTRLDQAGASALGYGLETGPLLTDEAVQEADRIGLPLFTLPRQTRFSAIAQLVAAANATQQQRELDQLGRLYDVLHAALANHTGTAEVLAELGAEVNARLTLVHLRDGRAAMGSPDSHYAVQVAEAAQQLPHLAADLIRLTPEVGTVGVSAVMVPLEIDPPIGLVIEVNDGGHPSRMLLQHLATATAMELVQLQAGTASRSRTTLLEELMSGRIDPRRARDQLSKQGMQPSRSVVVVARKLSPPGTGPATYLPIGGWRGLRQVSWVRRNRCYALVDPGPNEGDLQGLAVSGWVVGVGQPLQAMGRLQEATEEAEWTAIHAQLNGLEVGYFSESMTWVAPRSREDAERVVQSTIGPLVEHDAARGSQYVETIKVWLHSDRSWQRAAQTLGIHKQTLGYRLRRIEELLGHGATATEDVVMLWRGVRAHEMLTVAAWKPEEAAPGRPRAPHP
jgi:purine catabolism regulator